jgi:hypothetical protein
LPNNLGRTRAEIEAVLAASGLSWTVHAPTASMEHHGHQFGALRSGTARLTRATGTSGQAASACRHGLPGPVTLVSEGPNSASPVVRIADRRVFTIPAPTRVVNMKLIGATMGDKTRPPGSGGLWPSDHASVAVRLFFD